MGGWIIRPNLVVVFVGMLYDKEGGFRRSTSNASECDLLEVSVKYKLFLYGRLRESFVTVAAEVDVGLFLLELKKPLLFLFVVLESLKKSRVKAGFKRSIEILELPLNVSMIKYLSKRSRTLKGPVKEFSSPFTTRLTLRYTAGQVNNLLST